MFAGAFVIGLLSTLHCLGMCGGIVGALTFSLPVEIRNRRSRLLAYVSAYNLGRITSYTIAGAIGGGLGSTLLNLLASGHGRVALQYLAAAMMVAIGLYLAGWFPRFAMLERAGLPLWKRLEPLGRRLLPVRSPLQAFLFGLVWGWLPCGLVYSALIWTTTSGSALHGAAFMFLFGAGTLPSVMTAGVMTGWLSRLARTPYIRPAVGVVIIGLALTGLWLSVGHGFSALPRLFGVALET
jgi:sulfite exporter TauE/SafE